MKSPGSILNLSAFLIACALPAQSQLPSITTWHNDLARTGVNSQETVLNVQNVNSSTFGKLYSLPVDSQIYAQPLFVPQVTIPGQGVHDVLYVATMNNSVYAFDAESGSHTPLWHVNFGPPVPCGDLGLCSQVGLTGPVGILSTPVIDTSRGVIYVVAETYTLNFTSAFSLHALDYTTGKEKTGSPVVISGSVPGTGLGSSNGVLSFVPFLHFQRSGLTEVNGNIYIGFAGHGDAGYFHGWLFGYNGTTLRKTVTVCLSPNYWANGIWQSGAAFASDGNGNLYVQSGNGSFTGSNHGGTEWGEAVLKMDLLSGLNITSYFTPSNEMFLDQNDWDLGAGGVLVIPGTAMLTAPMVVAGGKDGRVFLLNSANLGGYSTTDSVVQEFTGIGQSNPGAGYGHWGSNVFYNNTLYFWGSGDVLRTFAFSGDAFSPGLFGTFASYAYYAASPALSVSSNGLVDGTGIVWATVPTGKPNAPSPDILVAYDATTLNLLWSSDSSSTGANYAGSWAKFSPPTIANGRVYVPTFDNAVNVFGLLSN